MERARERERHRDRDRGRERVRERERDREIDRERDRARGREHFDLRRGETKRIGAGESYKPYSSRHRSPLRNDTFRSKSERSSRRERATSPPTDSWHPSNVRDRSPQRRSRTPPRKDRPSSKENWRIRSPRRRTPPRRFSPRRDDDRRARSPPRKEERRNSRSPVDNRKSHKIRSPIRRSSPPTGPRGNRPRSRSLDRRDIPKGPSAHRRRQTATPVKESDRSAFIPSGNNSRRSSPPNHSDRIHCIQTQQQQRSPIRQCSPCSPKRERHSLKPPHRERPPVRSAVPRSPPRGPAGFRAPTGPGKPRNFSTPNSSPANHNLATSASRSKIETSGSVAPPSGPRGYVPRGGSSIRGGRGSFGGDRINNSDTFSWGAAPPSRTGPGIEPIRPPTEPHKSTNTPANNTPKISSPSLSTTQFSTPNLSVSSGNVPTGPRAGVSSRSNNGYQHSSTYSRAGRSASVNNTSRPQPTLNNSVSIIPSGRIDPTATGISSDISMRLKRREEEEESLRSELHTKEDKLRQSLKHWGKLGRDSISMELRSDLSEKHVRTLAGEGVGGSAF